MNKVLGRRAGRARTPPFRAVLSTRGVQHNPSQEMPLIDMFPIRWTIHCFPPAPCLRRRGCLLLKGAFTLLAVENCYQGEQRRTVHTTPRNPQKMKVIETG